MATTEELLEQMEQNAELYENSEEYCMLESDTSRVMVIPERYSKLGVESDEKVERIKFKFPKIVGDNKDLTQFSIRVNYRNANGETDQYICQDIEEAEDGYVTFSWELWRNVTKYKGAVNFIVCAVKAEENGTITNEWNTTLAQSNVLEGLEVTLTEDEEEQARDILTQLLSIMNTTKNSAVSEINRTKDSAKQEISAEGERVLGTIPEDYTQLQEDVDLVFKEIDDIYNYIRITQNVTNIKQIQEIVQKGIAPKIFDIGDQIIVTWQDKDAEKTYQVPLDIVHFGDVTLKDGRVVPGMYLQWHFATPYGVMFDAHEAFYYAEEELPAGTYYITVGNNWGTNCKEGETYNFTLTSPVPAGGQLSGFKGMPDQAPTNWRVYSWESKEATEPIETVSVTAGENGTSLGTLQMAGNEQLNNMQRTAYGYNRWSQSAIRQYLNSDKEKGKWWKPQNNYDRFPDQLSTKTGFLAGFEEEFLDAIGEVKVTTALNTITDASEGTQEDTYDKIFLPSLEQIYVVPQLKGVGGDYWEYWKRATGATEPQAQYGTYPERITYAIEAQTSAQYVRLRCAYRGAATHTWSVTTSGAVNSYSYATNAWRSAPACVIC